MKVHREALIKLRAEQVRKILKSLESSFKILKFQWMLSMTAEKLISMMAEKSDSEILMGIPFGQIDRQTDIYESRVAFVIE